MLYNISNKTLISTLKYGDLILSIKKISSNYFVIRESNTLSLVTLIESNKLVRTVILESKYCDTNDVIHFVKCKESFTIFFLESCGMSVSVKTVVIPLI